MAARNEQVLGEAPVQNGSYENERENEPGSIT